MLDVSNNALEWLGADQLQELSELRVLKVSHNKLASVAAGAVSGDKLRELYLDGNKLTDLPSNLCTAKALTVLKLDGNKLSAALTADGDGKDAVLAALAVRWGAEEALRKHKEAYPDGIMDGIMASIGTPGVNPGLVKAGYIIYFLLFLVVILQLVLMGQSKQTNKQCIDPECAREH